MAVTVLEKPWVETPLVYSKNLSRTAGCDVYLKLELFQPSGSFKSRGVGNLIYRFLLDSPPNVKPHVFSSSGGNAGLAAVTAANQYGLPSTVVIPEITSKFVEEKLKSMGAEVIRIGASWQEADAHCRALVAASGAAGLYAPPFDHPLVWEGNKTLSEEVVRQLGKAPDLAIVTVGGGGLLCGLAAGLPQQTKIMGVETKGTDSLNQSIVSGRLITLDAITSLATCLGARRVAERAYEIAVERKLDSVVVTDAEAAIGCVKLANDEKMLVELACGAGVAAIYRGEMDRVLGADRAGKSVVLVVCGGSDVDVWRLAQWEKEYASQVKWA